MSELVRTETSGGVLTITLNRPERKNALTHVMYTALGDAIDAAGEDRAVRCILLQAEGTMFTAGNDLGEFAAVNAGDAAVTAGVRGNRLLEALGRAKKPIVAAVQGHAVGVGLTMLLHCDLVFVAEDAKLSAPFVNLGLVPEAAASLTLPARIGHARAFAVLALGEVVDGPTAVAWGIANACVPGGELRARARAAAEALAARAPAAVRLTKALMVDQAAIVARMQEEGVHFHDQLTKPEVTEAIAAFSEKRAPDFSRFD